MIATRFVGAALAALTLAASPASANVEITGYNYDPTDMGGGISVSSLGFAQYGSAGRIRATMQDLGTGATYSLLTFCIDATTGIYTYRPYAVEAGTTIVTDYAKQTMLAGLLANGNALIDGTADVTAKQEIAAALGLAVWEVIYDNGQWDVTNGNFTAYGDFAALVGRANSFLGLASSGAWTGDVNRLRALVAVNGDSQNQLFYAGGGAVPEPAVWGLMILGLGAVGATMRQRRTRMRLRYS